MKYTPIVVRVPGTDGDELALTGSEARALLKRLAFEISVYDAVRIDRPHGPITEAEMAAGRRWKRKQARILRGI